MQCFRPAQLVCLIEVAIVCQRRNGCISQVAEIEMADPRIAERQKNLACCPSEITRQTSATPCIARARFAGSRISTPPPGAPRTDSPRRLPAHTEKQGLMS